MKKINTNRLIALLAALCLVTSCFVGSTLAKYITVNQAEDSARVAKWGVTIDMWNDDEATTSVFSTEYGTDNLTVKSSNTDKLVAPGTKNDEGISFKIAGEPEVAVQVAVAINDDTKKDVFLKAEKGTYYNMTTANDLDDTFDVAYDYYPVKYTLAKDGTAVEGGADLNLAQLEKKLEALSGKYEPNDMDALVGTYTITWAWAFGDAEATAKGNDAADTFLGNLAVGGMKYAAKQLTEGTDYNTTIAFDLGISVTQID